MLRRLVISLALASLILPCALYAQPVVPVERSDDDLVLVELRLGRLVVNEAIPGYVNKNNVMLPLGQLTEALQFPIKVIAQEGQADGWFLQQENHFTLDLARGEVVIAGDRMSLPAGLVEAHSDDIYVDTSVLAKWFPIDFNFSFSAQAVTMAARGGVLLPVQREAERLKARATLEKRRDTIPDGPYPRVDQPYQLYSMPFADVTYTAGFDQQTNTGVHNALNVLANGDLFYMHNSVYLGMDTREKINGLRWTLSRHDPDGKLFQENEGLGQTKLADVMNDYHVSSLEFGDINTPQLPLTAFNQQGRGALVSNMPIDRASQYDRTTLQGDIQPNWEVELYRNDELLSFQRATSNGRYEFVDVPLLSGLNIIRLVFYGPFGQTREEVRRFLVSPNLTKQGQSYFRFSAAQQNTSSFDILNQNRNSLSFTGTTPLQTDIVRGKARTLLEYEYGLLDNVSLFANTAHFTTADDEARHYISGGAATTLWGAYGRVDVAHDTTDGGNAYKLALQDNLMGVSFSGDYQRFDNFISEFTESVTDPVESRASVRADAPLKLPFVPRLNIGVAASRTNYSSDRVVDEISNRVSTSIDRLALAHNLTYRTDTSPMPTTIFLPGGSISPLASTPVTLTTYNRQTTGEIIASFPYRQFTFRGNVLYDITPEKDVQMLLLSTQYNFSPITNAVFEVDRQLINERLTTYTAQVNHKFDKFLMGANVSRTSNGKSAAGLTLSLSVGENPRTGDVELFPDYSARDGLISARAFHDTNGNGVLDTDEKPIENAKFLVNRGTANNATDSNGNLLIRNVQPDIRTSLILDNSSMENPYMLSLKPAVDVVTRPGVPVMVDFPVSGSGDIEGTIYIIKDKERKEAANVEMQVVDASGKIIKETRTSYDGYYLMDRIPMGDYTVRISPEQVQRLGFIIDDERPITISNSEDSSHIIDMTIKRKNNDGT